MATTQHYLWAAGHFLLLLCSLRFFLAKLMFRAVSTFWYKASFTGALVSYAIVCQKSLGVPQPNAAWIRRAVIDENVQYFLLALFWFSSRPVTLALLPYAIFSLFHALTFTRTTLMPQFLPPGPPPQQGAAPTPHPLAKKLQVWVKANYDNAMRAVAFAELVIMARIVVGALTFRTSLISPVIYAHFLRQRWYQSKFTREAFAIVNARIQAFLNSPGKPPVLAQVYNQVAGLASRWAGSSLGAPTGAPAGAAGGAGARRQ
ncbi:hypothetical protein K466DRAFT_399150 [Polyporus arcularius HHB13444]|uniref:Endoplasmic reticulum protein n=1 Tax=Polyporus arcularius HHB13444 TaxID=1314778 RepID=A0A5C3PLP3_9APHY|nr:hypothetical protein K466DRAFT_399150 [Polyporus arcularius HHB13444]